MRKRSHDSQSGPKTKSGFKRNIRVLLQRKVRKSVIRQQRKGLQWRKLGLPASALMLKKPWHQWPWTTARDEHRCRCTFRLVATHFACDASIDGHNKLRIYRYRYQWLWTKFRQRHVNLPKLWRGNVWNSDGGHKDPINRASIFLACVAGRRKGGKSKWALGGEGMACKDAIVFFVFSVHQTNVKILIGQI